MDLALMLSAAAVPAAGLFAMLCKKRLAGTMRRDPRPAQASGTFVGLRFIADPDKACPAAGRMHRKIFHAYAKPALPIPSCKRHKCRCRFEEWPDLRVSKRRTNIDRRGMNRDTEDRRKRPDRRESGRVWNKVR